MMIEENALPQDIAATLEIESEKLPTPDLWTDRMLTRSQSSRK